MSDSELNYTTAEKSLLSIKLAYDKFAPIMQGKCIFRGPLKSLKRALALVDKPERLERILLLLPAEADFDLIVTEEDPVPEATL